MYVIACCAVINLSTREGESEISPSSEQCHGMLFASSFVREFWWLSPTTYVMKFPTERGELDKNARDHVKTFRIIKNTKLPQE